MTYSGKDNVHVVPVFDSVVTNNDLGTENHKIQIKRKITRKASFRGRHTRMRCLRLANVKHGKNCFARDNG